MNPLHVHLMVNHLPLAAALFGAAVLEWGVLKDDQSLKRCGLWLLAFCGATALVSYFSGDEAAEVAPSVFDAARSLVHAHEEAAEAATIACAVTGALAAWPLWRWRRQNYFPDRALRVLTLAALISLLLLGWASYEGGQIRHSELQPDWKENKP